MRNSLIGSIFGFAFKLFAMIMAAAGLLIAATTISAMLDASATEQMLSMYYTDAWSKASKSLLSLFPYVTDVVDTLFPFVRMLKDPLSVKPISMVYDIVNSLILAGVFCLVGIVYKKLVCGISNSIFGKTGKWTDWLPTVLIAYISVMITDFACIHVNKLLDGIYSALPLELLPNIFPNLTGGTIAVVAAVMVVLLVCTLTIAVVGRKNENLLKRLCSAFGKILLSLLIVALVYVAIISGAYFTAMKTQYIGTATVIFIFSILAITMLMSWLFSRSYS